ncbi:class C sortase [Phocea massiliensis]|uniref:Class C sortase n=1 Tax=Merdimmobilis hominis TaxID=2897707 RepID=A0A939BCG5_9FIRM|nr:class C sortase [Merdimmobilis hominis]MBM6920079.1 class C sortase [Merdimmobilis hominis]
MKEKLWRLIRVLVILLGLGILIYPSLSQYLAEKNGSQATASYDETIRQMEDEQIAQLLAQAQEYNQQLAGMTGGGAPLTDENGEPITLDSYWDLLDIDGNGMMGYISIPRLNTTIPIYHGTKENVLQVGVGHLQNTSLPVGGASTHAAVSGHRGLPTYSLFTDLDRMKIGDQFFIKVLNQTMCYTVDQILTVLPDEMDALAITPGQDYVTLITCTPYGINSHRLLVRGVRSAYNPEEIENTLLQNESFWERLPMQYRHMLLGAMIVVGVLLLRLIIIRILRLYQKRR